MTAILTTSDTVAPPASQRDRFGELARSPYFEAVVAANRVYLTAAVADALGTEESHWALSCLPATNGKDRFSTVSMRGMETFVVRKPQNSDDRLSAFIIVAKDALTSFGDGFDDRGLEIFETDYSSADEPLLHVAGSWSVLARALLGKPLQPAPLRVAARKLAEGLLNRGRTSYSRYHDHSLAARVLGRL